MFSIEQFKARIDKSNFDSKGTSASKSRKTVTESSEYSDESSRNSDDESFSSQEKRLKRDLGLSHVQEQIEQSIDEDGM
jgi:hypothetical protein